MNGKNPIIGGKTFIVICIIFFGLYSVIFFSKEALGIFGDSSIKENNIIAKDDNSSKDYYITNDVTAPNSKAIGKLIYKNNFESSVPGVVINNNKFMAAPQNVTFTYENRHNNKYIQINNRLRSKDNYTANIKLFNDTHTAKEAKGIVNIEFDIMASAKAAGRTISFWDSNKNEELMQMNIEKGTVFIVTNQKKSIPVAAFNKIPNRGWIHVKFVVNTFAKVYDTYIGNSSVPAVQAVPFFQLSQEGNKDSVNTIGTMSIYTSKKSGITALDNIKVYIAKRDLECGKLSTGDIWRLKKELKNSNDIGDNTDILWKLQKIGTAKIIPALYEAIQDKPGGIKNIAYKILQGLPDNDKNAERELYRGLLSENLLVRRAAINKLNMNGTDNKKIAAYGVSLLQKGNPKLQKAACSFLGELNSDGLGATQSLNNLISDEKKDDVLRLEALHTLCRIDEDKIPLKSWILALKPEACRFFQLKNTAQTKLLLGGKEAVPFLRQMLKDKNSETKTMAITILKEIGPPASAAVSDLIRSLRDDKWYVSWEAQQALKSIAPQNIKVSSALDSISENNNNSKVMLTYRKDKDKVIINNGVIKISIDSSEKNFGHIISLIKNNGYDLYKGNRDYWDNKSYEIMSSSKIQTQHQFRVISKSNNVIELSFKVSQSSGRKFTADSRYVIKRGEAGYYYYCIANKFQRNKKEFPSTIGKINSDFPNPYNKAVCDNIHGKPLNNEVICGKQNFTFNKNKKRNNFKTCFDFNNDSSLFWNMDEGRENYEGSYQFGRDHADERIISAKADFKLFARGKSTLQDRKVFGPYYFYINSGSNFTELRVDAEREADRLINEWQLKWMEDKTHRIIRE